MIRRTTCFALCLALGCSGGSSSGDGGVPADIGYAPPVDDDTDAATPLDALAEPVTCTFVAHGVAELSAALRAAIPGSTYCLADGTYRDATLDFIANGTAAQPIVVAAQNPGGAIFTGQTHFAVGGSFVTLRGLRLENGQSSSSGLIELKSGTRTCDDCRLTETSIVDFDHGNSADTKWVSLYGQHDRVDHCAFSGKTNPGTLLVVWRSGSRADYELIDHNLFANRPPANANGNEAIRVGTGAEAGSNSLSIVEDNLFDAMSGEAEIVSNKSGANIYRRNTFRRCQGQLTLRNGSGCIVEGNIFLTAGVTDAGGIRVIGAHHRVVNNYVEGVRTTANTRGGIVLVSGEPNPGGGGYSLVADVLIAHNTLVDCDQSLYFGADTNPMAPVRVTLANNLVASARGAVVRLGLGLTSPTIFGNLYSGAPLGYAPTTGFREADAMLVRAADGLMRPGPGSPAIDAAQGMTDVTTDIDGQARAMPFDVGADETGRPGPTRGPLSRRDVGPQTWSVAVP
jgi:poly(beta-D-mannuronate) lyase